MKKLLYLISLPLLGCQSTLIPNNVSKGNLTFHSIKQVVKEHQFKRFIISFSSDIDFRQDKSLQLACLLKNNGKISQSDFDSIMVLPNSPSIIFNFHDSKINKITEKQFLYTISEGNYYSSFKFADKELATDDKYTNETIKEKILNIGLTCAVFDPYPTPFTRRYISNPMRIPKESFIQMLELQKNNGTDID